jgi:hypothetical protein
MLAPEKNGLTPELFLVLSTPAMHLFTVYLTKLVVAQTV